MADPRPSTDREDAPLLRDPERSEQDDEQPESFTDKLAALIQEPLTPLTKVLLVVVLILLLLASIFIGLFAGAQHKLNTRPARTTPAPPSPTTQTVTSTASYTTTVKPPAPTGSPSEEACFTSDCILTSAAILSSLDTSQDPCNNFYDYANGGWLSAHPLPADKGSFGRFEELALHNQQIIQSILDSAESTVDANALVDYDKLSLMKLRKMYASCMNETSLDDMGEEPLLKVAQTVRKLFSGESTTVSSPGSERHRSDAQSALGADALVLKRKGLTAAMAYLHSRGVDSLFSFSIDGDIGEDPNLMSLWFSQPGLTLPSKEYYQEDAVINVYTDVVEKILFTLLENGTKTSVDEPSDNVWPPWPWPPWDGDEDGGDDDEKKKPNNTEKAQKLAKHVVDFESSIADAGLDLDELYGDVYGTYNPVPFANLGETLPQINFDTYLSAFAPRNFPTRVIITSPAYVRSLADLLDATSADVVEGYLLVRTVLTFAPYLGTNTDLWQAQRRLVELLTGLKKGVVGDRAEYCTATVEDALGFASGRFFVNETFTGASKEKATKIITDIVGSFKESLKHLKWMDEESAAAAAQKADAIRVKVGYPTSPDTLDARSIYNWYSRVPVHEDTFFENILSVAESDEIRKWMKLGMSRNKDSWEMYPSTVNAYFSPPANEIVFPAGILQPPFYSKDWPSYLSYGAFGQVAAHELTHAFDSSGRLYNQDGKLEEWWTNSTSEGFNRIQSCISDQYSKYTVDDGKGNKVHLNGNLTSGENIGDSGFIQAHRAWKAQFNASYAVGNEYLLPGLNYTRDQLFFLGFAQEWARKMKPETAINRVRTDPHSPSKYRVEGTLSNIPEFAAAFNCPKGSKLNPPDEDRCLLW